MVKARIKVEGMHCGGCEKLVIMNLNEIDGVEVIEASHKSGEVAIEFDGRSDTEEKTFKAIKESGYRPIKLEKISG